MKITKAQKDAVISLLKEKFAEKQEEITKEFIKEHQVEIDHNINFVLTLQEEALGHITRLKQIFELTNNRYNKNIKPGELSIIGIKPCYNFYDRDDNEYLHTTYTKDNLLRNVYIEELEQPDYYKVDRELELASLGKDFDLDAFLDKYLPK